MSKSAAIKSHARATYSPPTLSTFGDVRMFTASGSQGNAENTGNPTPDKVRP